MTMEQNEKLEKIARQVDQIHYALFGTQGEGGLHRRVGSLERDMAKLKFWQAKVIGGASAVSAIVTFGGAKILGLFR